MAVRQYIGARYVPKFFENSGGTAEWVSGLAYEPLTIVTYQGNSFTSKKEVPANIGDPAANPEYWVSTGIYNQQIDAYRQEVQAVSENMDVLETSVNNDIASVNKKISFLNYDSKGMLVVGHAGASGLAPANTIPSFELAAMLKADAIECDVQITSDHVLVCSHNPTIGSYTIRNTDSATILQQTVTGNYETKFRSNLLHIPRFDSFLQICKNAGVVPIIEIKWEGDHILADELHYIYEALEEYGLEEKAVIMSWYTAPLDAYLTLYPNAKTMLLFGGDLDITDSNIRLCAEKGYYGVGIPRSANSSFVGVAHYNGLKTNVFTLTKGDVTVVQSFIDAGCDFFTTGTIIDVGSYRNPYLSEGTGDTANAHSKNGIAVVSKYFAECTDENFPTLNSNTSRFATDPADKTYPARFSEMNATYGSIVKPVHVGDVWNIHVPSGYRMGIMVFEYDGTFADTTPWITADTTYTITKSGHAIMYGGKTDGSALDYWDLMALYGCFTK